VKIISIKAFTPPTSGEIYQHQTFGVVKLIKKAGGDSWHCDTTTGKRIILSIKILRKYFPNDIAIS